MPHNPNPVSQAVLSGPRIRDWSLSWQIGAVVLGNVILALASYIDVPMVPVPVTMQTFAVTLIGAV